MSSAAATCRIRMSKASQYSLPLVWREAYRLLACNGSNSTGVNLTSVLQMETFDHWARDEAEMYRIIDYIENNPVRAGLVDLPQHWRWSSARIRADGGLSPGDPILKRHVR